MRVTFIFLLFLLCVQCKSYSQLSTEQKIQDFEFLYQTLEENYPYFEATKRQFNLDWLSNKEQYLAKIKNTPNDSAYLMAMMSIVYDLRCPHLYMPIGNTTLMLDVYTRATKEQPKYAKWTEVLEKSVEKSYHWQQIWENYTRHKTQSPQTQSINYADSLLVEDKIAIMRIKSFFYDNLASDSVRIISFLEKIQDYEYLIIDIQDNIGGSSNYWKKFIVEKINDTLITFPRYQVAKDGALNRHFYPDFFEEGQIATKHNTFFANTPNEILDGSYYIKSRQDTIVPNNPIPFKGKIFVLINERVVSAADDFAYFCKTSKWAIVAGVRTMGEGGNISEPPLFLLPNSGIVIVHPSVVGLNEDGSLNFETRTTPDIEIEAKNSDERLEKLIEKIKSER